MNYTNEPRHCLPSTLEPAGGHVDEMMTDDLKNNSTAATFEKST
jgi:hypothetical protein